MPATVADYIEPLKGLPSYAVHLDFLDRYPSPGSKIFLHPTTRLVTSEKKISQQSVLDFWSNQVFGSSDLLDYSAFYLYAVGRMHYVINMIQKELATFVNIDNLNLVDFAAGEGVFLEFVKKSIPHARLRGTEGSIFLSEGLQSKGFDVINVGLDLGHEVYFSNAEVGTLLWTLSCTLDAFELLRNVYQALPENAYLVVAESSRILVPFKKSLSDMSRKDRPADIHPNFFSATTLISSLASAGFKTIFHIRFHDNDVLVCIAQKVLQPAKDSVVPNDDNKLVIISLKLWDELSKTKFTEFPDIIQEFWAR